MIYNFLMIAKLRPQRNLLLAASGFLSLATICILQGLLHKALVSRGCCCKSFTWAQFKTGPESAVRHARFEKERQAGSHAAEFDRRACCVWSLKPLNRSCTTFFKSQQRGYVHNAGNLAFKDACYQSTMMPAARILQQRNCDQRAAVPLRSGPGHAYWRAPVQQDAELSGGHAMQKRHAMCMPKLTNQVYDFQMFAASVPVMLSLSAPVLWLQVVA